LGDYTRRADTVWADWLRSSNKADSPDALETQSKKAEKSFTELATDIKAAAKDASIVKGLVQGGKDAAEILKARKEYETYADRAKLQTLLDNLETRAAQEFPGLAAELREIDNRRKANLDDYLKAKNDVSLCLKAAQEATKKHDERGEAVKK